ncbi:MAG: DUF4174 domain-containing protein [Cyclobacteriaceae bacterium]
MAKSFYILIFLLISGSFSMAMAQFSDHRTIYLFTPRQENELYHKAVADLEKAEQALADRDLIIVHVFPDSSIAGNGHKLPIPARELRVEYNITATDFAVILVGKDRTVKRSWLNELKPFQEIFDLIDTMPMRRREMRERGNDEY